MSGDILGCEGAYSPAPYDFITTYGVLPESCFPYTSGSGSVPPCSTKCSTWEDLIIQIDGWHTVANDISSIKNALVQHGPLTAGMVVYDDFFDYPGGVYEKHGTDIAGAGTELFEGGIMITSTTLVSTPPTYHGQVDKNSMVWLEITAKSGTVQSLTVIVRYRTRV